MWGSLSLLACSRTAVGYSPRKSCRKVHGARVVKCDKYFSLWSMETVESKSFEVPVAVLLKTPNFWDVKLSVCARRFRYRTEPWSFRREGQVVQVESAGLLAVKMKALQCFETSRSASPKKQLYVPEGWSLQCAPCRDVRDACALGRYSYSWKLKVFAVKK